MINLFCLYMVCLGGSYSSGPLWTHFLPLLASYLQGLRKGFVTIAIMLAMILIIFYGPCASLGIAQYPPIFKFRFLGSLTMVCLMAFTYAYRSDMKDKLLYESSRSARNRSACCWKTSMISNRSMTLTVTMPGIWPCGRSHGPCGRPCEARI